MKRVAMVVSSLMWAASACWAQSAGGASGVGGPSGNPPQLSAELKAAFEACKSQGKPGDSAFEACMTSKGFKRPSGGQKPPSGP
jgi:hypothetical protein